MKNYFVKENTWTHSSIERGWGNGYAVIPKGHPMHGKDYNDVPVDIHGGLTFSEGVDSLKEHWSGVEDYPDDSWVFGFDTCHYGDDLVRWPKEAVIKEAKNLYEQLMKLK